MIRDITAEFRRHILSSRDMESPPQADKIFAATFDVCVVGSGPGGAVAAATLVAAGLKVLLVERGPFIPPEQFSFRLLEMSNRLGHIETTSGYRSVLYARKRARRRQPRLWCRRHEAAPVCLR